MSIINGLINDEELNRARAEMLDWLAHHPLFKDVYTAEQAEALAHMLALDRMVTREVLP